MKTDTHVLTMVRFHHTGPDWFYSVWCVPFWHALRSEKEELGGVVVCISMISDGKRFSTGGAPAIHCLFEFKILLKSFDLHAPTSSFSTKSVGCVCAPAR